MSDDPVQGLVFPPPAPFDAQSPDAPTFGAAVAPKASKHRAVRRLHTLLLSCDAGGERLAREQSLVRLAAWIAVGRAAPPVPDAAPDEAPQTLRMRALVAALEAFPALRRKLSLLVQVTLLEHSAEGLFARLGIPGDRGLLAETVDRLSRRLMPQPVDEEDVTSLLSRMLPRRRDADWIAALPAELLLRFIEALRRLEIQAPDGVEEGARPTLPGDGPLGAAPSLRRPTSDHGVWAPLRAALLDALQLLASRASAAGLSDALRARSAPVRLRESPFFRLPRTIDALLATPRREQEEIAAWAEDCRADLDACRKACGSVLARLEEAGVSVDVVYRLELIDRSLDRIELLLDLLTRPTPFERAERAGQLLAFLLRERRRDMSLADIVRTNTHLLARKIIERAGQTGEHYITATRAEYIKMLASAAGGGLLTGATAALKIVIGKLHRPLLQEGLLASANYAGSFLLMQVLGFTLATKQPSMTAAALAGAVQKGGEDREATVTVTARVIRSQLAAALGNVGMVIPAAIAVDWWWRSRSGAPLITPEYADKIIASLHPTQSGTIPYAILTGVILWASSLCAGWLENWAVYRRLPEAIAEHRLSRFVGQGITRWASRVFARNVAGFGGNVSIGLMLGMTHSLGQFAGVPLDVRHVTLSTGSLTFAALAHEGSPAATPGLGAAALGILVILALNLSVSFTLAMIVALRARDVGLVEGLRLAGAVIAGFFRSPLRFFLPVEKGAAPAKAH